jgi:hypothetical protein
MKSIVLAGLLVARSAWAELPVEPQQTVDHVARDVTAVGSEAQGCQRQRKCLESVAKKLDATVTRLGGLQRGLGLLDREALGIRIAWKVEPAVERATVALQLAVGQTETEDDRAAQRAREAAVQLYQWRDEVLQGGKQDREVLYAKIAPVLEKARPAASASGAVREDFEQTAVVAAWALRRALFRQDPHLSPDARVLATRLDLALDRLDAMARAPAHRLAEFEPAARVLDELLVTLHEDAKRMPEQERAELVRRVQQFLAMLPPRCLTQDPGLTSTFDNHRPGSGGSSSRLRGADSPTCRP